jgi:two-component system, OmpR family, sensor histidine kinase KdpD
LNLYNTRKYPLKTQIFWCILFVLLITFTCFTYKNIFEYRTVAMILLMTVSIFAMLFDIVPVLLASIFSALIWNFFFIEPIYTFHIGNTEDLMLFILYFVIAMVNAVLTFQIRKEENRARDQEEKEHTIKLYNTLLNSLSHELRTPISTIISSVDTLKEGGQKISITNQDELLNQIDIATIRLNRQVENLLNMSRLESGTLKLNIEWTDINDLIFLTIQKLKPYSQNHFINYQYQNNFPLCKLDAGIIEQVIYNILFNAINYTPFESKIVITTKIQDQTLEIIIIDNGLGISEAFIIHIFDKFYRLPNSKTGGIGLGLSIAKGFIEAHRGKITAQNNIPNGLQFNIKIPVEISYLNNLKNE